MGLSGVHQSIKSVKFKKLHPKAVLPFYSRAEDSGLDLTAISVLTISQYIEYDTGIAVELPRQHVGLLFPRSSVSNTSLFLSNSVGVVDENYRGSIKFRYRKLDLKGGKYNVGDRIGQLIILPFPKIKVLEVEELSETMRGNQGYGSSGE